MSDFIRVPADSAGKRIKATPHVEGVDTVYTQVVHVGDRLNPDKKQSVSSAGAATIAFVNGGPDFTGFGRTTVTESNLMGMYKFYQEDYSLFFYKEEIGGGTVARDAAELGLKLSTGVSSGDKAGYYSDRHYQYRPANSLPLIISFKMNDTGKANLNRRVGWFGDEGAIKICFELQGTTFNVLLEDTNLGTLVRVPRASWNGDRLDGSLGDNNLSEATLDLTKPSLWWISFQYPVGAITFGTYVNGKKIICHVMGNYNTLDRPFTTNPSYAFGMEQENVGVVASSSEMVVNMGVIVNDGYDEFDKTIVTLSNTSTISSTTFVPMFSFRPKQLKDGVTNRDRVLPLLISTYTSASSVEIVSELNSPLSGATWSNSVGNVEWDNVATAPAGFTPRQLGQFLGAGRDSMINVENIFPIQLSGLTRHYKPAGANHVTVFGRLISGATPTEVSMSLSIAEVE